ncbi:MAG: asparagine synthetase B, partial [Vicinamibacterales bacterium]
MSESLHLALGHNRLSIIDLSEHAAQPMRSRDGRYLLVYNGEIYNYREIAQELGKADLPDEDFGDTAVVVAALARWGPAALSKFNGMWALLFYDTQEKTLLVSRDRFGIKPLYFYSNGVESIFASEIKAILAARPSRFSVNPDVAIPYLTRGLLNVSNQTMLSGITAFPPASYQVINLRHGPDPMAPRKYWLHPFEAGEAPVPGRITPEELRALFLDSVRLRLRSDVPVGVLLSGGVDSSSIVGGVAAAGELGNLTVLSVTSDDRSSNEEGFIDMMARYVNTVPQKVNVSDNPRGLLERVTEACWFSDQPICSLSDIAYLKLIELARS